MKPATLAVVINMLTVLPRVTAVLVVVLQVLGGVLTLTGYSILPDLCNDYSGLDANDVRSMCTESQYIILAPTIICTMCIMLGIDEAPIAAMKMRLCMLRHFLYRCINSDVALIITNSFLLFEGLVIQIAPSQAFCNVMPHIRHFAVLYQIIAFVSRGVEVMGAYHRNRKARNSQIIVLDTQQATARDHRMVMICAALLGTFCVINIILQQHYHHTAYFSASHIVASIQVVTSSLTMVVMLCTERVHTAIRYFCSRREQVEAGQVRRERENISSRQEPVEERSTSGHNTVAQSNPPTAVITRPAASLPRHPYAILRGRASRHRRSGIRAPHTMVATPILPTPEVEGH